MRTPSTPPATARTGSPSWKTWVALVTVPLLVAGLLTWLFWTPLAGRSIASAAVVNADVPVHVGDRIVPLGRALAGQLVDGDDRRYDWVLTDAGDARAGLADGAYAAVVTIPEDFSAKATSTAGDDPLAATQAVLRVETSRSGGLVDPLASTDVAAATVAALNRQVVETYLDNVYVGFTTLHDRLGEAVTGARRLSGGLTELSGGVHSLADGGDELVVGLRELHAGSGRLASGADAVAGGAASLGAGAAQLSAGASELAAGTGRLAEGSAQLSGGLASAAEQVADLPEQTQRLADGAGQVADGTRQIADTVVPVLDTVIGVTDTLPSAAAVEDAIRDAAARCSTSGADAQFCAYLAGVADEVAVHTGAVDSVVGRIRAEAVAARDGVTALADGAGQVADGNALLAEKSAELVDGVAGAAGAAAELASGAAQVHDGASQLAAGAEELSAGASSLSAGAAELGSGASRLRDGLGAAAAGGGELALGLWQAADGADDAAGGAGELAAGLSAGRDQVPAYTDEERAHLRRVAASPLAAEQAAALELRAPAIAFFLVLGLWALGLATYLVVRAVPARVLTSSEPTWRLALSGLRPGAAAAVLSATVLSVGVAAVLDLAPGRWLALWLVALVAGGTFAVVNQAAAALSGRAGRIGSVAVLVLAVAGGVVSAVPGPVGDALALLPTHGAAVALRGVTTGGAGVVGGVAALLAWLTVAAVALLVVTERRRAVSARQLRLARGVAFA